MTLGRASIYGRFENKAASNQNKAGFHFSFDFHIYFKPDGGGEAAQHRADVLMRADRADPFLTVYTFGRAPLSRESLAFAIRDALGRVTPEYTALRAEIGLSTKD